MKNDCSVVKDLIPLYTEGLVSSETKEFIYEHCQSCEKCKELVKAIADSSDCQEENALDTKKEKSEVYNAVFYSNLSYSLYCVYLLFLYKRKYLVY